MKIYLRVMGGLGNQMFQYSYAKALKKIYKADKIVLDIRSFEKYKIRNFELNNFELENSVILLNKSDIFLKLKIIDLMRKVFHIYVYIFSKFKKVNYSSNNNMLLKKGYFFTKENIKKLPHEIKADNIYMYGYFLDESIIRTVKEELNKDFNLKDKSNRLNEFINSIDIESIAVSIRCGNDFEKIGWNYCDIKYYEKGLDRFDEKKILYVFADDIEKTKILFKNINKKIIYVEDFSPSEQIQILKEFKYYIISNSTFAWWGAYLSNHPDKIVLMPKQWTNLIKTKESRIFYENCEVVEI